MTVPVLPPVPYAQVHAACDTLDAIAAGTDSGPDVLGRLAEAAGVLGVFAAWAAQREAEQAAALHVPAGWVLPHESDAATRTEQRRLLAEATRLLGQLVDGTEANG